MNSNSNTYNISNEQLLLINILNAMHNDNTRQINNFTDITNNLNQTNNQIINLIIQILSSNNNTNRHYNNNRRNRNYNNDRRNRNYNTDTINGQYSYNQRFYTIDDINIDMSNNLLSQLLQNFLQPVNIYPSQTQIEIATRTMRYSDISNPPNTSCPISMEEFNDDDQVSLIRQCGHIFMSQCLNNWFRTNCSCPVCRYDIRNYNSNTSIGFLNSSRNSQTNNINN